MREHYRWRPDVGMFLRDDEEFAEFMDPVGWTIQNRETVGVARFVPRLQDALHSALNAYLNGATLARLGRYTFPLYGGRARSTPMETLRVLARLAPPGMFDREVRADRSDEPSVLLATIAQASEAAIREAGAGHVRRIVTANDSYDEAQYRSRDEHFLRPVRRLVDSMRHASWIFEEFLIHGSLATLDYAKGFSDFDTLLVLRAGVARDATRLRHARRLLYPLLRHMYAVDPLQHHGFFVITQIDAQNYPETYFPLELFRFARSISVPVPIGFRVRPTEMEVRASIWGIVQWLRAHYVRRDRFMSLFEFKLLLSFILLLPAIALQAFGEPTYKRDSFEKFRLRFGGDMSVIDEASELRSRRFPDVSPSLLLQSFAWAPPPLVQRIGKRLVRSAAPAMGESELLERGLAFAEGILGRVTEWHA